MKKFPITLILLSFGVINIALAATSNLIPMVNASSAINNLDKTIALVETKTDVPVLFPTIVPKATNTEYFANADFSGMQRGINYWINIDATKSCNGVRYCNIGYVSAERGANPQINYDMQNKEITVPVQLTNNIKGYFTPGHAMADFFPPQVQWREKNVLYTISWNTNNDVVIKMANSAIQALKIQD